MIEFSIFKTSARSRARCGLLHTPHGIIETPSLVPVATQAAIKAMTLRDVRDTQTQMLISNTFHLHVKPGEGIVKRAGGLHQFMQWNKPLMTDSGGFQVFSLGFGRDFGMGKILSEKTDVEIKHGQQPKLLRITDEGVTFTSFVDGSKLFLGPVESIKIQEALGADIMFAFDECTSPATDSDYTRRSLARTHRWAKTCLTARKSRQALFGIVQGGKFKELRQESARTIGSMPFDGFGIGGEFGDDKKIMTRMLSWVNEELPAQKPRHLLGIGRLEDIVSIIKEGIDTFDCIVPMRYGRRGVAFTSRGNLDMRKTKFLKDKKPLDGVCACAVCQTYSRAYLSHVYRAHEISAMTLLSYHNLHFFNSYVASLREAIKNGKL